MAKTLKEIFKSNFGAGDAAMFIVDMANHGTEIEDGILSEEAYDEWLDEMVQWFDGLIEVEDD